MLNSYGNDMTAANTANAAADAMKKDRLGTPGPPKNDWASQLSTALSSLGSKPADSATSTALPTTNEKLTRAVGVGCSAGLGLFYRGGEGRKDDRLAFS